MVLQENYVGSCGIVNTKYVYRKIPYLSYPCGRSSRSFFFVGFDRMDPTPQCRKTAIVVWRLMGTVRALVQGICGARCWVCFSFQEEVREKK